MPSLGSAAAHGRRELITHASQADSVQELFAVASERLARLVDFDAAVWVATDPATSLPTAPTRVENVQIGGRDACMRLWELEFQVEDVLLYRDLAQAELPAGGLRSSTHDRPTRSARFREFVEPNGFSDELRAVMRVDDSPWAAVSLFRVEGEAPFGDRERELVAGLSGPLAESIRAHAQAGPRPGKDDRGPGLLLFDPAGELVSVNEDAPAWLDELECGHAPSDALGVSLPMVAVATLMRARAVAEGRDHRSARACVRSRASGRWLVCHASCLRDGDDRVGNTALVIEPAQPSEVVPIVTEAYDLSRREEQITRLMAQGQGTAQIAERLCLSAHTVRDYIKTLFDKVGVSSRAELVAKLFAEHYAPVHFDPGALDRVGS